MISPDILTIKESIRQALQLGGEADRLLALSKIRLEVDATPYLNLDPFSARYAELVIEMYKRLTERESYAPQVCELTHALDDLTEASQPIPYRFADSRLVGEYVAAYGWILQNLRVKAGDSVLEYGSGEGELLLSLARLGCKAHAVDIEPRMLALVERHATAVGVNIQTQAAKFGDGFDGLQFDRIFFFEAFHHCFEHQEALAKIRNKLKPGGFLLFSGEPIIPRGSPESAMVPYPWGLRLDGESVRSISEFGWMELGFSEDYFGELLMRHGFSLRYVASPATWRGHCFIATPYADSFPILEDVFIRAYDRPCGWHASESTHRWTNGSGLLPLPRTGASRVTVEFKNLQATKIEVRIDAGGAPVTLRVARGAEATATVLPGTNARFLTIDSPSFVPAKQTRGSLDDRRLGVAVTRIDFR